ncbi:MAG: PleD family two-component system response regulator [Pseudomonadota bacterium]
MTARVLVVDDILANVKLLEARLSAEYFDVVTAMSGPEALEICERGRCDLVLLDIMMPGMDGFEVCERLKKNPVTQHLPVIMITALDQPSDKVRGLEAGADDFLTKPVSDVALITRVKSLARLKTLTDELRMRAETSHGMGLTDVKSAELVKKPTQGKILIIDDRTRSHERIRRALSKNHMIDIETNPNEGVFRAAEQAYDLFVVSLNFEDYDGLRLCSQLRSLERIRHIPILIVAEPEDNARVLRGLDIGVNDYIVRPIDPNELNARVDTQIRRKRYAQHLRENVQQSLEMAVIDGLTGLHNRRYMENHLSNAVDETLARGHSLALMLVDIDHFKSVNDTYGHDAGDEVLREFAARIRKNVRGADLACRFGGEEFVVVMPETDLYVATQVAERLRERVAERPFGIEDGARHIDVTISIGISILAGPEENGDVLLKKADLALYRAKRTGRNRVVSDAA